MTVCLVIRLAATSEEGAVPLGDANADPVCGLVDLSLYLSNYFCFTPSVHVLLANPAAQE